jgi:hypothetical protein
MTTLGKILCPAALLVAAISATGCYEGYIHDNEIQNMGFTLSQPLRTVMSDKNIIYVGVSIAGKREVDTKAWATFEIDPSLIEGTGMTLMPEEYYTLGDPNTMKVRKSNLPVADVSVTFTDAFYADPLSLTAHYAIPFRMTGTSLSQDSTSFRENAYTSVVAVKYISNYSGTYYKRVSKVEIDEAGNAISEELVTVDKDLVNNPTCTVSTISPVAILRPGLADEPSDAGSLEITFPSKEGKDCDVTVAGRNGTAEILSASGKYIKESTFRFYSGDTYAPELDLSYIYVKDGKRYSVNEKLVLRQNPEYDLRVETW